MCKKNLGGKHSSSFWLIYFLNNFHSHNMEGEQFPSFLLVRYENLCKL